MKISPRSSRDNTNMPLWTETRLRRCDLPFAAAELVDSQSGTVLLHSASTDHPQSRTSVLACNPLLVAASTPDGTFVSRHSEESLLLREDPIDLIERILLEGPTQRIAVGFLSYEFGTHLEQVPRAGNSDVPVPDLWFAFYDEWAEVVHRTPSSSMSDALRVHGQGETAELLKHVLTNPTGLAETRIIPTAEPTCLWDRNRYTEAFNRVKDYIRMGDIYQVNLAQPFAIPCPNSPIDIYSRLSRKDPMPYGAFLDCSDFSVISLSPECFIECDSHLIRTMPIKGTRPRSSHPNENGRRVEDLRASEKDRAEHIMIVDLERNDLGRICETGSVRVVKPMRVESFRHVHHLVSTVEGVPRRGIRPAEIVGATFPGGSITGAPKIRAMEIIAEVEQTARGIYTGAIGLFRRDGGMHFSIAIRTAVLQNGLLHYHAGGGIVSDSDCLAEYEESLQKARTFSVLAGETDDVGGN